MCSAIAASSVPALVLARGHKIGRVPEIPLVVSQDAEKIKKTKEAEALIKALKLGTDIRRSASSRKIRPGKGKWRNRRYVQRKGLLVVHNNNYGISRAFRNISGVNCINVNRLNLKEMAPGGHLGRFILWTEPAFKKLDQLYGSMNRDAALKVDYRHPKAEMTVTDVRRILHDPNVRRHLVHHKRAKLRWPKRRLHLLLTRKIRRTTILNSKAKQARKARLDALRAEGRLPPKKEKVKPTPRKDHTDPLGRPLKREDRIKYYKKLYKEKALKRKTALKERRKARQAKQVELAKKRKELRKASHERILKEQAAVKKNNIKMKIARSKKLNAKYAEKKKLYRAAKEKKLALRKARKEKLEALKKEGALQKKPKKLTKAARKHQRKQQRRAAKKAKKNTKQDAKKQVAHKAPAHQTHEAHHHEEAKK